MSIRQVQNGRSQRRKARAEVYRTKFNPSPVKIYKFDPLTGEKKYIKTVKDPLSYNSKKAHRYHKSNYRSMKRFK